MILKTFENNSAVVNSAPISTPMLHSAKIRAVLANVQLVLEQLKLTPTYLQLLQDWNRDWTLGINPKTGNSTIWDILKLNVDDCKYSPEVVEAAVELLAGTIISSNENPGINGNISTAAVILNTLIRNGQKTATIRTWKNILDMSTYFNRNSRHSVVLKQTLPLVEDLLACPARRVWSSDEKSLLLASLRAHARFRNPYQVLANHMSLFTTQ